MTKLVQTTDQSSVPTSSKDQALSVLARADSTMMQLMQAVNTLENEEQPRTVKIGVSSSATVDLLNVYLRKHGLLNGAKIVLVDGNYDDPIGDIDLFLQAGVEQILLLPFFDNLLPSFETQMENIEPSIIDAKEAELRQRYRMVFEKARSVSVIFLGTFHRIGKIADYSGQNIVSIVLARFNAALREEAAVHSNIRLIDTEDIVREVGEQVAFDSRFYFRSKAPYTGAYMNELARRITATARGFGRYFYKVLALDCDNTLWGGVIGEDLLNGIKLNRYDYPGNIFWRMQQEFSALERQGILLALVTKNNPADIDEVLQKHPDMVLKESQIVVKKVNWDDKPSNLRALAKELNVGLESIIFLDDSSFECEAVRQQLPMVKTMQVPVNLSFYPKVVAEIKSLFLAGGIAADSKGKTLQYRQRAGAEELKAQFGSQEEYLASLELKVELTRNARSSAGRISELSQKSNQFNLTTYRYSVSEIEHIMQSDSHAVYSLVVSDKFGNAGLTGVAVMRYEERAAIVENFFMSCRVIGRGVETGIWNRIVTDAVKRGCTKLYAKFISSAKNMQVADFYDRLGLTMTKEENGVRQYVIAVTDFVAPVNSWMEIIYVE
jgi:FkbH-like protein